MEEPISDSAQSEPKNVFAPKIPTDEAPEEIKFPWDAIGVEGPYFSVWVHDAEHDTYTVRGDKHKKSTPIKFASNKTAGSIEEINGLPL